MNVKLLCTGVALSLLSQMHAQDFSGYRTSNFSGVNSVFFNPANIVDNRYGVDLNLVSVSSMTGNNKASFSLKNIEDGFNIDSIKNQIFGAEAGKTTGFSITDIHGPSLMISAGPKTAFAITTRARAMVNVIDFDGKLADKLSNGYTADPTLPYTITPGTMLMNANAWSEIGFSLAKVVADKGKHFFKMGITAKYLAGAVNYHQSIANLSGTLNDDPAARDFYLANTTGSMQLGIGGIQISDFEVDDLLKMESSGFGGDIGFVYEYRPKFDKLKKADGSPNKRANKYQWKIGVALTDIGKIKYQKDMQRSGSYDVNINGAERFYLDEFENLDVDDYNAFFQSRPQYFTPTAQGAETEYEVSLPTTLQVNIDYHIHKGFYLNFGGQLSMVDDAQVQNSKYFNTLSVTPRLEGNWIGLFVPITYNEITGLNAGCTFRFGPVFVGSGSLITALTDKSKQIDLHAGVRLGFLR